MKGNIKFFYGQSWLNQVLADDGFHRVLRGPTSAQAIVTPRAVSLLQSDVQGTVLDRRESTPAATSAFTAYGFKPGAHAADMLAFVGERYDVTSDAYLLGNGHRLYSPRLMRFHSPDTLSPFARGGLNAYSYCGADPVNRVDPSGKYWRDAVVRLVMEPKLDIHRRLVADPTKRLSGVAWSSKQKMYVQFEATINPQDHPRNPGKPAILGEHQVNDIDSGKYFVNTKEQVLIYGITDKKSIGRSLVSGDEQTWAEHGFWESETNRYRNHFMADGNYYYPPGHVEQGQEGFVRDWEPRLVKPGSANSAIRKS
ncbi:RHS repeat-associated core domain-containing protein [Pseudomonas cremoricolorata]|uniref:RHS repeat-associated core domain-containing protein n=1 Tax=Pseudomonas cremoricolorata TaxID=157783 RepID=UPI0006760AD0|nr:RHS repeat-associated core domain-containing protein [Pseudomonas cremoricolorata]